MIKFIKSRAKSIVYAIKGFFLLIRNEEAILVHIILTSILVVLGLFFKIDATQWAIQFISLSVLFVAEGMNTAIEKICDFIHPDFHKKIGEIKDVSAGVVSFAMLFVLIISIFIYLPYIL